MFLPTSRGWRIACAAIAAAAALAHRPTTAAPDTLGPADAVASVGMTVSDMNRALAFYGGLLPFAKESDFEVAGREHELLTGVFGARLRTVRLRLGDEAIELTEFKAPRGRAYPADTRGNDRWFQHIAIIVSDMDRAYATLTAGGAAHASTGPQRLPDWNVNAGGIQAYYFRDPDGHFLEILQFPAGKGDPKWHRASTGASAPLFLGIDHTAIVTADTDRSRQFYQETLGLRVAGTSMNFGVEQEHLNNVFGARLRITTLKAAAGPGVELLEYLAPADGRPAPADLKANDLAHWQTTIVARGVGRVFDLASRRVFAFVSPEAVTVSEPELGFRRGVLLRDPDGHGVRLVEK
jgi:catechol 2,3-dioxygenase-like lactoylglutathione lyase family enzyme